MASSVFYLWVCVVVQVPRSVQVEDVVRKSGLAISDAEFYNTYLDFIHSRQPQVYMPVAITCAIIGVVGNGCFLFFFGNPTSDVYLTRDALYFRWLAAADMLVCVFVLPYAVVFEAKLIESALLCKTLEYIRHVLIFAAHLLLMSYCLELNENDNYVLAKERLTKSLKLVLLIGCIFSVPVLFLFDVGITPDFSQLMSIRLSQEEASGKLPEISANDSTTVGPAQGSNYYSSFVPHFCHMLFNYDSTAKYADAINILKTVYFMTFGFLWFASTILVVYKSMQFVDENPLIGRESIFVRFIESDNPQVSDTLQRLSVTEQRRSQYSGKLPRASQSETLKLAQNGRESNSGKPRPYNAGNPAVIRGDSAESSQMGSLPVHARLSTSVDSKVGTILSSEVSGPLEQESTPVSTIADSSSIGPSKRSDKQPLSPGNKAETRKSFSDYEMFVTAEDKRRGSRRRSSSASDKNVPLVKFLLGCECLRSRGKRVQPVRRSFKMALASAVVADVLIAAATVVFYQITDQISVSLNLIHLKSVFSFYVISVLHADLRRATWGFTRCRRPCRKHP